MGDRKAVFADIRFRRKHNLLDNLDDYSDDYTRAFAAGADRAVGETGIKLSISEVELLSKNLISNPETRSTTALGLLGYQIATDYINTLKDVSEREAVWNSFLEAGAGNKNDIKVRKVVSGRYDSRTGEVTVR